MRFELTTDQRDFAASLDSLLASSGTVAVARAWADGDHAPGLSLWERLSDQGLLMLAREASPLEVVIAFEALGRHAVPGPWVESAAYLPIALGRDVDGVATVAVEPHQPRAVDADVAQDLTGAAGAPHPAAFDLAVLAASAQLLGAGERVLADSVTYVKQRRQFGREIGSYQAIKHALADVRIALDFARPLVYGAALGEVSAGAAKVQAGDAAYLASRTGLQVHGAIGYTAEFDLSVWISMIRVLRTAWGTPSFHRARLLEELTR